MTTTCPNCGSPVAAGERFCGECGTDLTKYQQGANRAVVPPSSQPSSQPQQAPYQQPQQQAAYRPPQQAPYQPPANPPQPAQPNRPPYSPGPTPGYPGGVTPLPQQRGGAPPWVSYLLLGLAVVTFLLMVSLGAVAASADPSADGQSAQLGFWVCGAGFLFIFGVPGLILFFVRRR